MKDSLMGAVDLEIMSQIPSFDDPVVSAEYSIVENESSLLEADGPINSLLLIIKPVFVSIIMFHMIQFVPSPHSEKRAKFISVGIDPSFQVAFILSQPA